MEDLDELDYELRPEDFEKFDWEKIMVYTPCGFVFSLSREDYLKVRLRMEIGIIDRDKIIYQASIFKYASEDLRQYTWTEFNQYLKYETCLDVEDSDILYCSTYKAYPTPAKQRHRASQVEKRIRLMKLLTKKQK
jgi:hypothetical protein